LAVGEWRDLKDRELSELLKACEGSSSESSAKPGNRPAKPANTSPKPVNTSAKQVNRSAKQVSTSSKKVKNKMASSGAQSGHSKKTSEKEKSAHRGADKKRVVQKKGRRR
jgi:hypothetical protein